MSRRGAFDRFIAVVLTLAISAYWIPATSFADGGPTALAEIRGNVFASDGLTAVAGVTVKAANLQTSQVFSSSATAADGSYAIASLPPGTYDLAVQTPQGLFAADSIIETTAAGGPAIVSLALKAGIEDGDKKPGDEPEKKAKDAKDEKKPEKAAEEAPADPEPEPEEAPRKKRGAGFFRSPWGATILIFTGAGLVGVTAKSLTDDDDDDEDSMTGSGN